MVLMSTFGPLLAFLSIFGLMITYKERDYFLDTSESKRIRLQRLIVLNTPIVVLLNIWIRDL